MDTPVAPLDEEMLVDLAKEPAVIEGGDRSITMIHGKTHYQWLCSVAMLNYQRVITHVLFFFNLVFNESGLQQPLPVVSASIF